jgi:hypothetical protein
VRINAVDDVLQIGDRVRAGRLAGYDVASEGVSVGLRVENIRLAITEMWEYTAFVLKKAGIDPASKIQHQG